MQDAFACARDDMSHARYLCSRANINIQDTISSRALGLGRVRARAKVSCIQLARALGLKGILYTRRYSVSCIQADNKWVVIKRSVVGYAL